jgi:4-hydroxyacetophenone monooxygenase
MTDQPVVGEPKIMPLDPQTLRDAVAGANVPTLLVVLRQITGDERWMSERYRIARPRGVSDNDTGGLDEIIQDEIREAALEALTGYLGGAPLAIPEPSADQLIEMLQFSIGEEIPLEYGPMIKDDMRAAGLLADNTAGGPGYDPTGAVPTGMVPPPLGFRVGIIGGGVSGITTAIAFEAVGIDYVILEKHDSVGGTWLENRYPGAGVDTPNHLYSWPGINNDWQHYFSLRDDVLMYLRRVADGHIPAGRLRLATEVTSATFDEAAGRWNVVAVHEGTATVLSFDVVISAVGLFNTPSVPRIEGADSFRGESFHTADWPEGVDLRGKRVCVIGNGASAMQVVPAIAPDVAQLTVFQRSPQWIAPFEKFRVQVPPAVRDLIQGVPLYRWWYRARLMWMFNDRFWAALEKDPDWPYPERSINATNERIRLFFLKYMNRELAERPDLLAKVVPSYPPYVKRILFDNGWFKALKRDNVELVTEGVERLTERSAITTSGAEYPVDVVIYATGFQAVKFLSTYDLVGRGGTHIREIWGDDDARAYLGTAIPGFPNFFCMYGPNLQAGHGGSFMTTAGAQVNYIMSLLDQMFARGIRVVDCKQEVCDEYNARVDEVNSTRIWTHPGTHNYYRNSRGRVVVNRAFKNLDYWIWTRRASLDDYEVLSVERDAVGETARG